jgi:hypothetical protein
VEIGAVRGKGSLWWLSCGLEGEQWLKGRSGEWELEGEVEMDLGLGFPCLSLGFFKISPLSFVCVVYTCIYRRSVAWPQTHWSLNFFNFCKF